MVAGAAQTHTHHSVHQTVVVSWCWFICEHDPRQCGSCLELHDMFVSFEKIWIRKISGNVKLLVCWFREIGNLEWESGRYNLKV